VKGSLPEEMFTSNHTWESINNLSFIPYHGIETFVYIIIIELDTIAKKCSKHSTFYVNVSLDCGEILPDYRVTSYHRIIHREGPL